MADLKKKTKSRNGHRAFVQKKLQEVREILQNTVSDENRQKAEQLEGTLRDQLESITKLDVEIQDLLVEADVEDDLFAREIEEAAEFKADVGMFANRLKAATAARDSASSSAGQEPSSSTHRTVPKTTSVKLPKLEIKRYGGQAERWHEFWDSYESAIHRNESLTAVEKFCYLRGLLEEPALSTIAGFSLTATSYEDAVELLKRRYGKTSKIQRVHINELLNIRPVQNARETNRLRSLYETVEAHHRGLKSLGVDPMTYSTIVVPSILEKLPEVIRLSLTRGKDFEKWNLDDLLKVLQEEVELREYQTPVNSNNTNSTKDASRGQKDLPGGTGKAAKASTASTLFTKSTNPDLCAFCLGTHKHEHCNKVTNVSHRKQLVRKYGRCFICLGKNHLAKNCKSELGCNVCKGKHHTSICESPSETSQGQVSETVASPILHVGANCRVALQTAQAVVVVGNRKARVRVMFDSGSHRSFVTHTLVSQVGLDSLRKEWIEISTFGHGGTDRGLRDVVQVDLLPLRGGESVRIEAYVVPTISEISNEHVEVRKREYPYLQSLWFSDVCQGQEVLEVDVLIGADYLWCFQSGRTIRGEVDQPVAVETTLGWVLSGPMKGSVSDQNEVQVNFVSQRVAHPSMDSEVRKLWDLETLGIRQEDEVLEGLKDSITFTGERYKVSLPWKEGHDVLPKNYDNSYRRLCSQLRKLQKEPDILREYDNIIAEQLSQGVVEQVSELEPCGKEHYLPHHAVVRRDAKTTKVRVVYDASSKEGKKGVSLNDCLHVGPALSPMLYDILIRFRAQRVAVVGDIEKAFLNIEVSEGDRDSLRFLWVKDVSKQEVQPVLYRFCRVVFGVNCSPFLLNATLRHHLDSFSGVDQELVRKLKDSFYVDDLVSGEETEDRAFFLYRNAKEKLAVGGFKLRKWLTNSLELRQRINQDEGRVAQAEQGVSSEDDQTYAKAAFGSEQGVLVEKNACQ